MTNGIDKKDGKNDYLYFNDLEFSCFVVSSNNIDENENTSSDEMESDQPTSTASRSQTDDDIVEVDGE
jgi:hypothetical protein